MRELVRAAGLLLVLVSVVTSQDCTTGEARLVDYMFTNENNDSELITIVQVCYNGGWTTVCGGNGWSGNSANVVCRQLGYSEYATWSRLYTGDTQTTFSGVTQYTYLTSSCGGDERVLTDCGLLSSTSCYYNLPGSTNDGYYYATVTCQPNNCTDAEIRLVGGASYREGRVEVCVDGRWGTVCGEGWTNEDAGHVCTRLGYPSQGATKTSFGEGTGLVYDSLDCQQAGASSDQCVRITPQSHCTDHTQDLGVRCKSYNEVYEDECNEECETKINETLSSLTTPPPVECPTMVAIDCHTPPPTMETTAIQCQCPTQPLTSATQTLTATTSSMITNKAEAVSVSTMLGLGVFAGLTTVALVTVIIGWIITCVYYQQKMKTQLTKHTPSQPPTQASHPDVMYDYIDKIPAPPPGSCDLTTNEAYDSVVQCVTNDSYSVITAI